MPLEMRGACEKCSRSLAADAPAYICSYECTFCPGCADAMRRVCPNCKGELVARPRRRPTDATIASTRSADEVIRASTVHQVTSLKKPGRRGSP